MSGKAAKGSATSKCRRKLANSVKNKISQLKNGDITVYFHMPAHGNGLLVYEKQGLQAQQSVAILSAIRDHLHYSDKRLEEEFSKAQAFAEAVAAYEGKEKPVRKGSSNADSRGVSGRATGRSSRHRKAQEQEDEVDDEEDDEEGEGEEEPEQQTAAEEEAAAMLHDDQQARDADPAAAAAAAAAAADEAEIVQWLEEYGPDVAKALGRVLQGLEPGIATFADVCDGVETATALEYMPDGLVSAPFKRAVKNELCALFASVTGRLADLRAAVEAALELQPDVEVAELYKDVALALELPHAPLASSFRKAVRAARSDYMAAAPLEDDTAQEAMSGSDGRANTTTGREAVAHAAAAAAAADESAGADQAHERGRQCRATTAEGGIPERTPAAGAAGATAAGPAAAGSNADPGQSQPAGRQRRAAAADAVAAAALAAGDDDGDSPADKRQQKDRKRKRAAATAAAAAVLSQLPQDLPAAKGKRQKRMLAAMAETRDVKKMTKAQMAVDPFLAVLAELEGSRADNGDNMEWAKEDIVFANGLARNSYLTGVRGAAAQRAYAYMVLCGKLAPAAQQS